MFTEIRESLQRNGPPILIEVETLRAQRSPILMPNGNIAKFRSVFGYDAQTVLLINQSGSTAGLKERPVHCDEIIIDIDEDVHVSEVHTTLMSLNINFSEWRSRRGMHFHIPIVPIYGTDVVHSVKTWIFSILDVPFDSSMLHQSGQIRLPWSVHNKDASIVKIPLASHMPGIILQIPRKQPPPIPKYEVQNVTDELTWDFFRQLDVPRGEGNRTPHLFIIAKAGMRIGLSFDTVFICAKLWNRDCARPPHDEDYIRRKLEGIFRRG